MPAVAARHHLDDGAGLAVAARPQHDAVVGPFHGGTLTRRLESSTPLEGQRLWIFSLRLVVADDETSGAVDGRHRFRSDAALKYYQIAELPIEQIGMDQVAA